MQQIHGLATTCPWGHWSCTLAMDSSRNTVSASIVSAFLPRAFPGQLGCGQAPPEDGGEQLLPGQSSPVGMQVWVGTSITKTPSPWDLCPLCSSGDQRDGFQLPRVVTCSLIALGRLFFLLCLSPHPSPTSPFSFLGITSHLLNYMYPCPSSGLILRGPKPRPWRWVFLSSHGEKLSAIWRGLCSENPGAPWCPLLIFSI